MKAKTTAVTLAMFFVGALVCFAADNPQLGTWKLNEAKSKIGAGMPKIQSSVYEAAGDSIKVTTDGENSEGKTVHTEWTGKFDGKDYPVSGDPTQDTRSYMKVSARTLALKVKKDGKVTISGRITVAPDGKTRTVTTTRSGSKGKKVTSTAVYDKA